MTGDGDVDYKSMTIISFERLLLSKINEIKEAGNGHVTRSVINTVLGVDPDDDETIEVIRKKLRMAKCIRKYYKFNVEGLIDPDENVIRSDPDLLAMRELLVDNFGFDSKITRTIPKNVKKKCKHCKHWNRGEKSCSEKDGRFLGVQDACTDGSFLFNPDSFYRKKK